ncbi:Uncharacterized protein BM_BM420 [Brugia malayi]|uniref:Uncharacterized protein n=1 Tax=Brugia malayi TaxID=6279 RepID=A0A4E9EUI8_BRUMA|nr:Uncharacterized protein BM_BM420 [Brugia malayi]VIO86979.1 Uncharacterized protein BM_BM420 [Brugia malayi]
MSVFVQPTLNADQEEGRLSRMLRRPTKRKYSAVRIISTVSTALYICPDELIDRTTRIFDSRQKFLSRKETLP